MPSVREFLHITFSLPFIQPGQGNLVAFIIVNTILSGSAGSITCMVYKAIRARMKNERIEWSMEMCILGGLAGLVLLDMKLLPMAPLVFLSKHFHTFKKPLVLVNFHNPFLLKVCKVKMRKYVMFKLWGCNTSVSVSVLHLFRQKQLRFVYSSH